MNKQEPVVECREVRMYEHNIFCCSTPMEKSDEVLTVNPPIYQYTCSICGNTKRDYYSYPFITYE